MQATIQRNFRMEPDRIRNQGGAPRDVLFTCYVTVEAKGKEYRVAVYHCMGRKFETAIYVHGRMLPDSHLKAVRECAVAAYRKQWNL